MQAEHADAVWLTDSQMFSLADLAELSGLSETELRELVDYGAVTPVVQDSSSWVFSGMCLQTVRMACRLRIAFDLQPHDMALVVSLLDRIHDLEAQLASLRARRSDHAR